MCNECCQTHLRKRKQLMDNTLIFVTQLATIFAFVIASFGLYRLLVSQKDSTIEAIRERLETERSQSPMVLTELLDKRVTLMEKELKRLDGENIALKAQVEGYQQQVEEVQQFAKESKALKAEFDILNYMFIEVTAKHDKYEKDFEELNERHQKKRLEWEQQEKHHYNQLRQLQQTNPDKFYEELEAMKKKIAKDNEQ